jgi:hypothetical protein
MALSQPDIPETLGVALLGGSIAALLSGTATIQCFVFYHRHKRREDNLLKGLVSWFRELYTSTPFFLNWMT